MRVIITAGGTGGHIYPAIAIINKIKKEEKNSDILYIGTTDRMEKDIIPKMGINFKSIEMVGLNRKNIFKNFGVLIKYKKAINNAKQIIKEFNPDVVIGVGGYISAPVVYAAHRLGVKTIIHEQNSIPGVSNRFLSKFVDKVCVSLPKSAVYFDAKKTIYTGNPRSEEIINSPKLYKNEVGLSSNKKLVIIVMGSLGSTTMTDKLIDAIPKFNNKTYQVLVITGNSYFDSYKSINCPDNVMIVPFLDNLINLMKDADLIVSRAGASTIAEITAIGLPSILVPSPYVTNNHQMMNAKELEEVGGCTIIEEGEFSSDILIDKIDKILSDSGLYNSMVLGTKSLGVLDSATKFYDEVRKLVGESND